MSWHAGDTLLRALDRLAGPELDLSDELPLCESCGMPSATVPCWLCRREQRRGAVMVNDRYRPRPRPRNGRSLARIQGDT